MPTDRQTVEATDAPKAIGAYSHGVTSGGFLFCSGQIAIDPEQAKLIETGNPAGQARLCLEHLTAICRSAGTDLANAVKVTIYLADMSMFKEVNETYAEFFASEPPARVALAVAGLPLGAEVEIDAIVARPD